jgi:hypothetical protein
MKYIETLENKSLCLGDKVAYVVPTDDTPEMTLVIPSGWFDLFHVITEDGESMQSNYALLDSSAFGEKFGFQTTLSEVFE